MPRKLQLLGLTFLCLTPGGILAGQAPSIRDWKLVCFCNSRVRTPHFVVQMDNNGVILYAARSGTSRTRLRADGIPTSDSQLRLLVDWELLKVQGDSLRTAFPVLGPDATKTLRAELRTLATRVLPDLRPLVDSAVRLMRQRMDSTAVYSAVFSYILDGLVWDSLAPGAELVATDITVDHPFWHGAFWAISSERDNAPGTNSSRLDDSASALLTWTQTTLELQQRLETGKNGAAIARAVRQSDPATLPATLAPYKLFSPDRKPRFALIDERGSDPTPAAARALAGAIARGFRSWIEKSDLPRRLGISDSGLATLILYHEHMWDLLDGMVAGGAFPKPVTPRQPTPSDIAPLITVILRSH